MCGSLGSCAGAEKGALGSLGEAAVGVPRQGAGWRRVGFSARSALGGVEYATVCYLKRGAQGSLGELWMGVPRQGAGWHGVGLVSASAVLGGMECAAV
jgi:hypothetical protein